MKKTIRHDIGEQRADVHRGTAPRRVTWAVLIFYAVAGLLNGEHLLEQAELMPFGPKRDACIALAKPLARASELTHLSTLRYTIEERLAETGWNTP